WGSNRDARIVRLDYHGSAAHPPAAVATASNVSGSAGNTAPALLFAWPPNGSFFDVGSSVSYEVNVSDAEAEHSAGKKVAVRRVAMHDTPQQYSKWMSGVTGTVHLDRDGDHLPHLFCIDDRFVLESRYTDSGEAGAAPISTT